MIKPTSTDEKLASSDSAASGSAFGFVVALVALLTIMVGSIYYPYPSGKHLDFWSFVALWARELIAIGILVVTVVALAIVWLYRRIKAKRMGKKMRSNPAVKSALRAGTALKRSPLPPR